MAREGRSREESPIHHSPLSPTPPPGGGSAGDIPGKACPGCRPRLCPSPASSHTPDRGGNHPGRGRGGNPLPVEKNHTGPPRGSRAGAGAIVVMAREGRSREESPMHRSPLSPTPDGGSAGDIPGKACPGIPIIPATGIHPYTGPWGYHPGRGRGGNSLPVEKNHTGPPRGSRAGAGAIVVMAREGRSREESPIHHSPLSPTPPPDPDYTRHRHPPVHRTVGVSPGEGPGRELPPRRKEPYRPFPRAPAQERGGNIGDIPEKAGPGCRPRLCPSPASTRTPDRGGITRGGNSLPVEKNHTSPPRVSRAGAGAIVVMAREGRSRGGNPYTALLSPPPPAGPDYARHRHPPVHRTVGISPGEGPGREPPPRRREPYRPSPGPPRRSGGYRGDGPGRA